MPGVKEEVGEVLYNLKEIIEMADKENRGIAAFNVFGFEDAKAVVLAAEKLNRPVALMANKDAIAHMGARMIGLIMREVAERAKVPVCVHLDHATQVEVIEEAIEAGFTSVMFDGSQLPFDENVRITRQVVAMARPKNISVEAEIGAVGYSDKTIAFKARYTEPEEAKVFSDATRVDALAVAVGTVHRMEAQGVSLQFNRLRQIAELVKVPLVIHGSTGVEDKDLTRLVENGARKINLGTTLRMTFGNTLRKQFEEDPHVFDRIVLFKKCMDAVQEKAEEKIKLL